MTDSDFIKEHMEVALRDIADKSAREFAEATRERVIDNLDSNNQGEEGLIKYVGDVKQERNELGRYTSAYAFEIKHPTAKLHERGGPIEPTYGRAMGNGWDRDGFYDALKDCEYQVRKKRYLRNAVMSTMQEVER